jgi:uroporphyrinogen III methyltransferase / synthase
VRQLLFIEPDCMPESFVAEALAEELIRRNQVHRRRFVLLRAEIARPMIVERLLSAGARSVQDVPVYETRAATSLPEDLIEAIAGRRVDWITFTSSSTAQNFTALLGKNYLEKLHNIRIASIGPITTTTLTDLGLPPTVVADNASMQKLVEAIIHAHASADTTAV